jgi:hypothetical protein
VYGIKILPADNPYIEIAEKGMAAVAEALNLRAFLADYLPFRTPFLNLLSG